MARTTQRQHAGGEGRLAGNVIAFIIVMVLLLASFVAFAMSPEIGYVPAFTLGLILFALAFFIPQQILGRSDSHEVRDGSCSCRRPVLPAWRRAGRRLSRRVLVARRSVLQLRGQPIADTADGLQPARGPRIVAELAAEVADAPPRRHARPPR